MHTSLTQELNALLEHAIKHSVAPGLQCVVFNRDEVIFNGATGYATLPNDTAPEGKPMTPSTIFWMASCIKLVTSLVALHVIERGLTKNGFTMTDLDNHDKLVELLPEFKQGEGNLLSNIIEGFESPGTDGKKVMKLREAKNKVTLRMLLTHTAGIDNGWHKPLSKELYNPTDGSVPNKGVHYITGKLDDLVVPLVCEPGTEYLYSLATAWVGVFAERATDKTLVTLVKEIILDPLGIHYTDTGLSLPRVSDPRRSTIYMKDFSATELRKQFIPTPFSPHLLSDEVIMEEGKIVMGDAGLLSSCESYVKILQAVLNQDPRILNAETWNLATRDDLNERGISVPNPEWDPPPSITMRIVEYANSTDPAAGAGCSLLSCRVARAPTITGRPKNSFGWAGATNIYYFLDGENGLGGIIGAQFVPFFDTGVINLRDEFETLLYKYVRSGQL